MAFKLSKCCYYFISLKYINPSKENKVTLCLEQVKAISPDLDCSDFPFLLIAQNESRLVECFAAAA